MLKGLLSSGDRIRTCDLRVMSPTSYLCSTPQYILKALRFVFLKNDANSDIFVFCRCKDTTFFLTHKLSPGKSI